MDQIKKLSPAAFAVIIICFFLPFVSITCGGQSVMTLTGIKLITGAEYKAQNMFDQQTMMDDTMGMKKEQENIDPQPMALLALLMAVAGAGLSFIRKKMTAIICAVVSVLGAVFLLLLKASLDGDIPSEAEMVVSIEYQFGYWLALLLFIAEAVLQWLSYKDDGGTVTVTELPPA